MDVTTEYLMQRHSVRIDIDPETGCHAWTGSKRRGYGEVRLNGRKHPAHRLFWIGANGPIPDGMNVDHICWNKSCVNVEHLRLATPSQNNAYLRGAKRDNTSGHRNVYWDESKRRWRTVVDKDGKRYRFGQYTDVADAARAAEAGRVALHGAFAGNG